MVSHVIVGKLKIDRVTPDYPLDWKTEIERAQHKWKNDQKKWFDYIFDPHYDVTTYDLYTGAALPALGINTKNTENLFESLEFAMRLGYRYFHTSLSYNNQEYIAKAISSVGLRTSSIYLSLKIQPQYYGYESVINAVKSFVKQIEFKKIGLCLMDGPQVIIDDDIKEEDKVFEQAKIRRLTWMALETLNEDGICGNLGVANYEKKHLVELMSFAKYKPAVNMIEFHPYNMRKKLKKYMVKQRMIVISEDVLNPTGDNSLLKEPLIRELAVKYAKTPSQIVLKWAMQQAIVALPSDNTKQKIADNAQILGFELEYNDLYKISQLHRDQAYDKTYQNVDTINWKKNKELDRKFAFFYAKAVAQHEQAQIEDFRAYKQAKHKTEL